MRQTNFSNIVVLVMVLLQGHVEKDTLEKVVDINARTHILARSAMRNVIVLNPFAIIDMDVKNRLHIVLLVSLGNTVKSSVLIHTTVLAANKAAHVQNHAVMLLQAANSSRQ